MSDSNFMLSMIRDKFNNDEYSDFEIHVENTVFKVNRMMLKLHSDVFRAYFNHDSQERQTGIIKIEGSTTSLVESMMRFMYTNKVENLDEISYDLFILADRYNVVILKNLCAQRLIQNMSLDTIFNCLEVAYLLNAEELKQKCLQFVIDNESQIQTNDEWTRVTNSEPSISRDLCHLLFERLRSLNPPQEAVQQDDIEILEVVEGSRPTGAVRMRDIDNLQAETRRLNERFRQQLRQLDESLRERFGAAANDPNALLVFQQNPAHREPPAANQANAQREEANAVNGNSGSLAGMRAERRIAARHARQEHRQQEGVLPPINAEDNEQEPIEIDPEPRNQERVLRPRRRLH